MANGNVTINAPCSGQLMSDKLQLYYYIVEAILLAVKEVNDILESTVNFPSKSVMRVEKYNALVNFLRHPRPLDKNEQLDHLSPSLEQIIKHFLLPRCIR
jgi:hypothetical protein